MRSVSQLSATSFFSVSGAVLRTRALCHADEPLAIIHAFAPSSHVVEDVIAANADLLGR